MTEVFIDVCNFSRQVFPTISRDDVKGITKDPQLAYSVLLHGLVAAVGILRHVVPPTFIFLFLHKLWDRYVTSCRDLKCNLPLPPGESGLPFLGETLQMIIFNKYFFERKRAQYGDIFRTHLFGRPAIRVVGAENVKYVLRGENTLVEAVWPESTRTLIGEGSLAQATGHDHILRKRTVMKLFTFDSLSSYVPIIQEVTQRYVRKWISKGKILGYPEFKILNFDLSCRLLLGLEMDEEECERLLKVFDDLVANLFCIPLDVYGSGFRKGKSARETLLQKLDEIIQNRKLRDSERENKRGMLGLMFRFEEDGMSEEEMKNTFIELLFAGHGTTSSTEAYLVYLLAQHKEVRENIVEELASHGLLCSGVEADGKPTALLSMQQLNKLTYINNVVKETLRVSPPVGGGFRKALKTFELGGYQVPEGWSVVYGIRETHDTDGYFTENRSFNPDRWSKSEVSNSQFKYLPFGAGRRACAGKDLARIMLKIFALELAKNCEWKLENSKTTFTNFPMPCPKDNLPLVITKRLY